MNKRQFIKNVGLLSVAGSLFSFKNRNEENDKIEYTNANQFLNNSQFELPNLPYAYDGLEPFIDKQTMEIHHDKHHKAYVDNLNKVLLANNSKFGSLEDILHNLNKKSEPLLRNNVGGHWNHSFFWESMSSTKNQNPGPKFMAAMQKNFTDFETFKTALATQAIGRFGSGWAWVCKDKSGNLFVTSTPNQDNPLMKKLTDKAGIPILAIDVWEHAYYLKYQNKRADYIKAFFSIINWAKVEERLG